MGELNRCANCTEDVRVLCDAFYRVESEMQAGSLSVADAHPENAMVIDEVATDIAQSHRILRDSLRDMVECELSDTEINQNIMRMKD